MNPSAQGQPCSSRVAKSMRLYRRAETLIPGGTQLVSRRPTRLANGISPVYAERAFEARFWDVHGNEYIVFYRRKNLGDVAHATTIPRARLRGKLFP